MNIIEELQAVFVAKSKLDAAMELHKDSREIGNSTWREENAYETAVSSFNEKLERIIGDRIESALADHKQFDH